MTELATSCCTAEQQASCCESSAKHECCGPDATAGGGCGCSAGQAATAEAPNELRAVVRERWDRRQVRFTVVGLLTWYVVYAAYRNVKSYVPFVNPHLWDGWLQDLDRAVFLGHDPYTVLHDVLGRGLAAHALSYVYLSWVVVVPFTLAVALVWSRDRAAREWYVTAVALDWVLDG
jgi:hypothetical protein